MPYNKENRDQGLITCPKCGQEFELSDALTGRIREHLKVELRQEIKRREADVNEKIEALQAEKDEIQKSREAVEEEVEKKLKERIAQIEEKAEKKFEGKYAEQLNELQSVLKEKDEAIKTFRAQELELLKKQRELEDSKKSLELDVARKIDEERETIAFSRCSFETFIPRRSARVFILFISSLTPGKFSQIYSFPSSSTFKLSK